MRNGHRILSLRNGEGYARTAICSELVEKEAASVAVQVGTSIKSPAVAAEIAEKFIKGEFGEIVMGQVGRLEVIVTFADEVGEPC